jgi:hypothetical protein
MDKLRLTHDINRHSKDSSLRKHTDGSAITCHTSSLAIKVSNLKQSHRLN